MQNSFSWDEEFSGLDFVDKWLTIRFIKTMENFSKSPDKSIFMSSKSRSEAKAVYRMLGNENFSVEEVKRVHKAATIKRIQDSGQKVILAVQDTTGVNYNTHKKTEGLGYFCEQSLGINLHTCLAVTVDGLVLGVLHQSTNTRAQSKDETPQNIKKQRKIEDKESYRWLETMEESSKGMSTDVKVIHVCDREGDIYQLFNKAVTINNTFLIRVVHNRSTTENEKIIDEIKAKTPAGSVTVTIPRDSRRNIKARKATLDITFAHFNVKKPEVLENDCELPDSISINIIYIKERQIDSKIEPIEWILGTNDLVDSWETAYEMVCFYIQRWKIEMFHHVLKSGCTIEKLQERSVSRTVSLIFMYSVIAVFIMNLTYMARINPDLPCSILFDEEEWKILYCAANKTKVPPEKPYSIKNAVTYLSQLGGPKRAPSDGPPGLKLIWIGLMVLQNLVTYREFFV
jgi:hypothetical protein